MPNGSSSASHFFILLALVGSATAQHAHAAQPACPLEMPAHAIEPGQPGHGWKAHVRSPVRLDSAGLIHGPYDGRGYLAPDTTQKRKDGASTTYHERWDLKALSQQPRWLVCGYGPVELFKAISPDARTCEMTSVVRAGFIKAMHLDCK